MSKILNITNGDSAVSIMQEAYIIGDFLPWRDVLHDGPVPDGLSLEELSRIRTQFIVECGWGSFENIRASFIKRDNHLRSFSDYQKVILWFEHDLYDQLQIIQILDWFNHTDLKATELSIICVDQYLGMLSPEQIVQLYSFEELVSVKHLALSTIAWSAFCSKSPEKWHALLKRETKLLPFLEDAIIRQLEEYPNINNGLSRTAQQILRVIMQGENNPWKIFVKSQALESRIYLGGSSFWMVMEELLQPSSTASNTSQPLLSIADGIDWSRPPSRDLELRITPMGEAVLAGDENVLAQNEINRWIGGVHLSFENLWYWDSDKHLIVKSA